MSSDPMKDMMAHLTVLSDICQSEGDQTPEGKAAMDNLERLSEVWLYKIKCKRPDLGRLSVEDAHEHLKTLKS